MTVVAVIMAVVAVLLPMVMMVVELMTAMIITIPVHTGGYCSCYCLVNRSRCQNQSIDDHPVIFIHFCLIYIVSTDMAVHLLVMMAGMFLVVRVMVVVLVSVMRV